jgi:hypothetical protein
MLASLTSSCGCVVRALALALVLHGAPLLTTSRVFAHLRALLSFANSGIYFLSTFVSHISFHLFTLCSTRNKPSNILPLLTRYLIPLHRSSILHLLGPMTQDEDIRVGPRIKNQSVMKQSHSLSTWLAPHAYFVTLFLRLSPIPAIYYRIDKMK